MRLGRAASFLACVATLAAAQAPKSGLELANFDRSIRPQDDLFTYANGRWMATAEMPSHRVIHGAFTEIGDRTDLDLRELIEDAAGRPNRMAGSPAQQIGDLYASLMDEGRIEALGWKPIEAEITRIEAARTIADLSYRAGYLSTVASGGPFPASLATDVTNPRRVIATVSQGGILLPGREYYVSADPKYLDIREKYLAYLTTIFELTGRRDPSGEAREVLAFETALAHAHQARVDALEGHTPSERAALRDLMRSMPGFDWVAWGRAQGIDHDADILLAQPSFFKAFAAAVGRTSIETLRAWLASRHITAAAPFLSSPFAMARFDFFGRTLSGQTDPIPQWKRAVSLVSGYLGDALGKLYVERRFPPDAKARVERLVANMIDATRQAIQDAGWMAPDMRDAALDKLAAIVTKVGYPERWRDYSGLVIKADDLVGNIERAQWFDNVYRLTRVTRDLERGEWLMPPQTINAYYSPGLNEIVVPAAMLQPPLFQLDADDAVNYGAIGAVIGHELGHGFDAPFQKRAAQLVAHFKQFSPLPGTRINGELTLGENIGDLGGLALAYRAYQLSLDGNAAPVIDGFTGDQRFFLGWAQVWRSVIRDEYLRQWLTWIPHAPPRYRANGPLSHLDAFYAAFNVKPGDTLYVEPEKRVRIW